MKTLAEDLPTILVFFFVSIIRPGDLLSSYVALFSSSNVRMINKFTMLPMLPAVK